MFGGSGSRMQLNVACSAHVGAFLGLASALSGAVYDGWDVQVRKSDMSTYFEDLAAVRPTRMTAHPAPGQHDVRQDGQRSWSTALTARSMPRPRTSRHVHYRLLKLAVHCGRCSAAPGVLASSRRMAPNFERH